MGDKARFILVNAAVRNRAKQACMEVPDGWSATFLPPGRSKDQNAAQWPYLTALAEGLQWPMLVNGQWQLEYMDEYEWKDFLSALFVGEAKRLARGTENTGLVMVGCSTSSFSRSKFSEYLEFVKAFCAQHEIEPIYKNPRKEDSCLDY